MNHTEKPEKRSNTELTYLTIEIFIWITIALLAEYGRQQFLFRWIKEFSVNSVLTILGIAIIPILYKLVTQRLPIEYLRIKKQEEIKENEEWENFDTDEDNDYYTLAGQMEDNVWMAKKNSETIYSRSNTFLFSGTLLAILGVAFFYWHSDTYPFISGAGITNLIELSLQRFGGLFFIEGIAFFFLKQYSNSMEDYRYYESIKHQRENQVTIFLAIKENGIDYAKNLSTIASFNEDPNKLKKEETTQLLEAKKVIGPDTDVLQKVIDLLHVARKG